MRELFWRVFDFIVDDAAAHIGRHYFGTIGAFLAPVVVYLIFQSLTEAPKTKPTEAEPRTDVAATRPKYEVGPVGRLIERVTISLLAAIPAGVVWAYLARGVPWVGNLGVDPGVPALGASAITFAWLYRSNWKVPLVVLSAILLGVLLLKFGELIATRRWLVAAGVGVATVTLIWTYGSSWKAATVSVCSIALGLYLLSYPVPIGPIGLALCVGGVLVLIVASPGVAAQR